MKRLPLLLTVAILICAAQVCYTQNVFFGAVVEIKDGRSFVLETPSGRINGVLQFIDVPESEQAFHQTVIDHLRLLTIGKTAEFKVSTIAPSGLTGRLVINGVDISVQMLRDGAAWLIPTEQTGQPTSEFELYKESEDRAKADHLGVWSIPDLKPAWVIRAENAERLRIELASRPRPKAKLDIVSEYQTVTRPDRVNVTTDKLAIFEKDAWLDTMAGTGVEEPGIKTYTDPKGLFVSRYTSAAFINFASAQIKQRLECRAIRGDVKLVNGSWEVLYLFGFRAISDDFNFSTRASSLSITADGQTFSTPLLHGIRGRAQFGATEIMYYRVSLALLKRISRAQNVQFRIDKLSGAMPSDLQRLIGQLLAATG
jgi:Micrococcal nuclease (thermonuclease) homologs